jgi:hypothetical protein
VTGDDAGAEKHWRAHLEAVGRLLLGSRSTSVVEAHDHY